MRGDWRRMLKLVAVVTVIAVASLSIGIAIGQNQGFLASQTLPQHP
jgi:hypothetical protein